MDSHTSSSSSQKNDTDADSHSNSATVTLNLENWETLIQKIQTNHFSLGVIPCEINTKKIPFSLKVCTCVVPITDIFYAEFQTSTLITLWDIAILMTNVVNFYYNR